MTDCGLTNLAVCLPEKIFEYLIVVLNQPLQFLLNFVKSMITEPVNVEIFYTFWALIVYIISMFYGLFMLFAGFNFMISGYNSQKRENAKAWLRNIVLMILFIQSSFLIYSLAVELSSMLSAGMIGMIDPSFFLLKADNFANIGLQFLSITLYLIVLVLTTLLFGIRYILVSIGIVLLPSAIFFYFIPALQNYGKLVINVLLVIIFIPFASAIIIFGTSMLATLPVFNNFSIILAVIAFLSVDLVIIFLIIFALVKSAFSVLNSDIGKAATMAGKYLL